MFLYTSVQDSISAFIYHPIDTVAFGTINILPLDSTQFTLYNTYTTGPTRFHYDINVIVIWPVASTLSNTDTLAYVEVITLGMGINELNINKLIKAYPNPVVDKLTIENSTKNIIEEVRIYDASGQLINVIKNKSVVDTENWCPGMYIIDVKIKDQKEQRLKILKQ
jgi:hypothetical protein